LFNLSATQHSAECAIMRQCADSRVKVRKSGNHPQIHGKNQLFSTGK
jgi:hypothetical protein